jgi:hypothetical protein
MHGDFPMTDYSQDQMFIKLDPQSDAFKRAQRRARVLRPHVRAVSVSGRDYEVRSGRGDHSYRVRLAYSGGNVLGLCECASGADGKVCYHLPVALGFASGIKRMRKGVE